MLKNYTKIGGTENEKANYRLCSRNGFCCGSYSWGAGNFGQIGDGSTSGSRSRPVEIMNNVMLPSSSASQPTTPPSLTLQEPLQINGDIISYEDYRKLNEILTRVNSFPGLSRMTDYESLIYFGAYISMHYGGWGERGSKESVEAILNRYFGVERIYHERSSLFRYDDWWDVDYPMDGVGGIFWVWYNASSLGYLGNGLYLANVDMYTSSSWNESFYNHITDWDLPNNATVQDWMGGDDWWTNDGLYDTANIFRNETGTVTLRRFVFNGENTWQILSVNGNEVPRVLFP
jgi:hypothetical protein